ncbi:DUF3667 domain-containing protein [Porticoccaceae bacterium LTM1]|nr:DUF3667 domain-containing protein [Porticoccaceae bacterium LTM1]
MSEKLELERHCENCGTLLQGEYCHRCGQEVIHNRRFFGGVILDLLNTFFSYDSKVNRTFLPLFFKPGFLTREYMAGRRARYILPFRLYLFTSVFCFILLSFQDDLLKFDVTPEDTASQEDASSQEDTSSQKETSLGDTITFKADSDLSPEFEAKLEKLSEKSASELVNLTLEATPKVLLLLMPIMALVLKLFYLRSRIYFVDHFVAVLHCQSFLFLMLSLIMLISYLGAAIPVFPDWTLNIVITGILLWALIYLPMALKQVYRQSTVLTVVKYLLLLIIYGTLSILTIIAAFGWSLFWL